MRILFSSLWVLFSLSAWAIDHAARIVKMENESQIYIPLVGKTLPKEKVVRYLEKDFKVVPAKRGMKLQNGYVITTGPKAKLKIIFANGDHFFVSPNTQYQIQWEHKADQRDPSTLSLLRGAVRGLIEKDGPRSGMKVITKNTVMGVRGTDFHVSQFRSGLTQVSVLRGEIEVKNDTKKDLVQIAAGQTFMVNKQNSELSKLSQPELKVIAEDSTIKTQPLADKELNELESKATSVTMKDIQIYDPELFKQIKNNKVLSSDELALNTVEALEKTAPQEKKKPKWADLLDDTDPYEKYKPKN